MNRRIFAACICTLLCVGFLQWGCAGPECQYDDDCAGSAVLCTDGKCVKPTPKDGGTIQDTYVGPPPECQDGNERACYTGADSTKGVGPCKAGTQTCQDGKWGECSGEVKPADKEECNDKDDDCDGLTDEGCSCTDGETKPCYGGPDKTRKIAPCREGKQVCTNGKWDETCTGEFGPQKDECDGIDNDCNGQIDDDCKCKDGETKDCYVGPPSTLGQGNCKKGTMVCGADGKWGTCSGALGPQEETCNGQDDNCDGQVDDGCTCTPGKTEECYTGPQGTAGQGVCKKGTRTCDSNAVWGPCRDEVKPGSESCNGKDDDCNGQIDDNLQAPACAKQEGVCAGATKECKGEQGWIDCDDARYTSNSNAFEKDETQCDGKDNDCDGSVDENLKKECFSGQSGCVKDNNGAYKCEGSCQSGTQLCTNGAWAACTGAVAPTNDTCDGEDNDCDGDIDEGCQCRPGETRNCYGGPSGTENKGVCKGGQQTCDTNGTWGNCVGETTPGIESCNGKDDDCNGQIDDGLLGPPCSRKSGVCVGLRKTCGGAVGWVDCSENDYKKNSTLYETVETSCDGKDNDCDGVIDENLSRSCYTGASGCTKGSNGSYSCTGTCKAGTQTCQTGSWGICQGSVVPKAENCTNKLDDNCNGQVDECGVCTPGQTRPCYTGTECTKNGSNYNCVGACKPGTQTCQSNKQWATTCSGQVSPKMESCNWQDDDCDGKIDNQSACIYAKWKRATTPSGATKAAFFNPKDGLAIGNSGKIWRTTNGGSTWSSVTSSVTTTLRDIAIHPNGLVIIVGSSGTILRSADMGRSFSKINSPRTTTLYSVSIGGTFNTTNNTILIVGSSGTLIGSKNGGTSFQTLTSGTTRTLYAVRYKPNTGTAVFVGSGGTIRRTTNYGSTWTTVTSGTTQTLYEAAWSPSAAVIVGSSGTILRSTSSGSTWSKVTFTGTDTLRMAASPGNDFFVVGSSSKYYVSTDQGATFYGRSYGVSGSFSGFALVGQTSLLAIASNGQSGLGASPSQLVAKGLDKDIYSITYDNQYGSTTALAAGESGTILRSTDRGASWHHVFAPTSSHFYGVSLLDSVAVAVGRSGAIYRSADEGKTWRKATSGTTSTLYSVAIGKHSSSYYVVAVGSGGTVLISKNSGSTWTKVSGISTSSTFYGVTFKDPTIVLVGSSGNMYRSTNAGTSWSKVTTGTTSTLRGVYLYDSGDDGVAVGSSGTILYTTNGGSTWTKATSNTTQTLRGIGMDYANAVAVGDNGTILRSTDSGKTWSTITGQPNVTYYSAFRLYASSNFITSGRYGSLLLSTNRGSTWSVTKDPGVTLRGVSSPASKEFVTTSNIFTRTTDSGTTWTYPSMPESTTLYGITTDTSTGYVVAVGTGGRIQRSLNRGSSWSKVTTSNTRTLRAAATAAARTFVVVGDGGTILQSTTGGSSFTTRTSGTTSTLRGVGCHSDVCIAVGSSSTILRSTFRGSSWSKITSPKSATFYGIAFGSASNAVIVGSSGSVLYTTNAGLNWKSVSTPTTRSLYAVMALNGSRFVAVDSSGRMIASGDGGQNWTFHSPPVLLPFYGLNNIGNVGAAVGDDGGFMLYTSP